jgi:hypothetical protein
MKQRFRPAQDLTVPARKQLCCCLQQALAIAMIFVLPVAPAAPSLMAAPGAANTHPDSESESGGCELNSAHGQIKHVIFIQFNNVHFTRDNPNVPSDLEQMPHLRNFIKNNGVLPSNHHTPLISHAADEIITALTGVYGDRQGIPVANSFGLYNPPNRTNSANFPSWFTY